MSHIIKHIKTNLQKFHANVDLDGGAFLRMNGEMDDLSFLVWFIVPLHKKW